MKKLLPLFALLAFFLFSNQANAQLNPANPANTNMYAVTKNDGKEHIGKILSINKVNSNSFPFPMCTWFFKF